MCYYVINPGEWCLESLFCRGAAERVQALTNRLRDFDAVKRVKMMVIWDNGESLDHASNDS